MAYIQGCRILGDFQSSQLFRPITPRGNDNLESEFYGPSAEAFIDGLTREGPRKDAADIWQRTQDYLKKGFANGPYIREDMNNLFTGQETIGQ